MGVGARRKQSRPAQKPRFTPDWFGLPDEGELQFCDCARYGSIRSADPRHSILPLGSFGPGTGGSIYFETRVSNRMTTVLMDGRIVHPSMEGVKRNRKLNFLS